LVGNEAYPVTLLESLDRNIPTITYRRPGTEEIQSQYKNLILVQDLEEAKLFLEILSSQKPRHIKETAKEFTKVYKEVCNV